MEYGALCLCVYLPREASLLIQHIEKEITSQNPGGKLIRVSPSVANSGPSQLRNVSGAVCYSPYDMVWDTSMKKVTENSKEFLKTYKWGLIHWIQVRLVIKKKKDCWLLFSYIFFLIPAKQSMLCSLKLRLGWKQQTPNELQVCAAFTHLLWLRGCGTDERDVHSL